VLLVVLSGGVLLSYKMPLLVETLELDIAVALRSFELGVRLTIGAETVALVGPSGAARRRCCAPSPGCGARPRAHRARRPAWFDAAANVDLPPERRSVGLVFQEYALFPHMTGARPTSPSGRERRPRARAARARRIAHLADERPAGCRAASASAWPSPAPWRATRRSCSSTSRSRRSTRTRAPLVRSELQDVLGALGCRR
jgi:hypothetical protein